MPDRRPPPTKIALIMMISALTMAFVAGLIYLGVVPVSDEARGMFTLLVAVAAAVDFLVAVWFFRKGQTS